MDTIVNAFGDEADLSLPSTSKIENSQRFTASPPILLHVTVFWYKSNCTRLFVRATDYCLPPLSLYSLYIERTFHPARNAVWDLFPGTFPTISSAAVCCYSDICYSKLLSLSSLLSDL
jgi:hypothetical protein